MSATVHHLPGVPCPHRLGRTPEGRVTINRCKGHPTEPEPASAAAATGHPAGTGGTRTASGRRAAAYRAASGRLTRNADNPNAVFLAQTAALLDATADVLEPPDQDRTAAIGTLVKAADTFSISILQTDAPG